MLYCKYERKKIFIAVYGKRVFLAVPHDLWDLSSLKVKVKVAQLCQTLCNLCICIYMYIHIHDHTVHGILQVRILERVAFPFSRGSWRIKPRSPSLQEDSLPAEPQGKPKFSDKGLFFLTTGLLGNSLMDIN